jgi:hypothetical protein
MRLVDAAYRPNLIVAASAFPPGSASPAVLQDRPLIGDAPRPVVRGLRLPSPVTARRS